MGMKSLGSEADVESTQKAMEQAPSWFLKIPDKKTPWYFLSLEYADGYVHWYNAGGLDRRIVCDGGLEGKGFATDDCSLCAYVLELYQEAKRLKEEGHEGKAKAMKDRANKLHANAEVQFKAIRGQRTLMKTDDGKEWIADWDTEDEDSSVDVGIITLSEAQFDGLTAMIKGEHTEFIKSGDDLGNRILWTSKEKRKNKSGRKYNAVVWDVDEKETEIPDLPVETELLDMDLRENFALDSEELAKVYELVSGQKVEETSEDEVVELEENTKETPTNADLDDLPADEDPGVPETDEKSEPKTEPKAEPKPEPKPETTKQDKPSGTASAKTGKTSTRAGKTSTRSGKARL